MPAPGALGRDVRPLSELEVRRASVSLRSVPPVGTNTDLVECYTKSKASQELQKRLLNELGGRRQLITIGRADYSSAPSSVVPS